MAARNRLPKTAQSQTASTPPQAGLLGVAFDAEDGHKRLTRGENFVLVGGSQETHEVMQETAIKANEQLDARGKRLADVSPTELRDILHDILDR